MTGSARTLVVLVLWAVIAVLGVLLYRVIHDPYAVVVAEKAATDATRARMGQIRAAMILYERGERRYVSTLDSLITFAKTDSLMVAARDSVFMLPPGAAFNVDSLKFSPRTGKPFELAVNDTSDVKIYLLKDPDSDDQIGTLDPIPSMRNAASWE